MKEIGLQLYSVRDSMKADLPGTLEKVAKLGYKTVEFAGFYGYPAKEIKSILDANGLKVVGTHTGLNDLTDKNLMSTLEYMNVIGNKNIVIPSAPYGSKGQQRKTIERINTIQPIIEKEGKTLSYHNHSGEFFRRLFTPSFYPNLVEKTGCFLEVDTFWAYNAGQNPLEMLEKYSNRIRIIHLKDGLKGGCKGRGAVGKSLGSGNAPVKEVYRKALDLGLNIVVESETQNPTGIEEVTRCIDFLKSLDK